LDDATPRRKPPTEAGLALLRVLLAEPGDAGVPPRTLAARAFAHRNDPDIAMPADAALRKLRQDGWVTRRRLDTAEGTAYRYALDAAQREAAGALFGGPE
jgi:hypothetical protein